MIITQKKPLEEVMAMVGDAKTVAVIGCGLCASTCQTGGAPEVEAMKKTLEEAGKTVVVTDVADACCMKLGVRAKCKAISAAAPECIVCMSCGDGVQTIAKNCTGIPVYPANNTMFLGEVARAWRRHLHHAHDYSSQHAGHSRPQLRDEKQGREAL